MDIKPRKAEELVSENDLVGLELKGELPNGGARILEPSDYSPSSNIEAGQPKLSSRKETRLEAGFFWFKS